MKKFFFILILGLLSLILYSQDATESNKVAVNETEVTEEFYSEKTMVSANKIHYLHPDYPATHDDVYDIVYLLPSMNESNTIAGFVDNNYIIAGRTTQFSSIRDIEIRSENGTHSHFDLYKYQRFADKKNNPFLKPNDVITIKKYNRRITKWCCKTTWCL